MYTRQTDLPFEYIELLNKFSQYLLLQRNLAPATVESYTGDATLFIATRLAKGDEGMSDLIKTEKVQEFLIYLRGCGVKNSTIKRRLNGVQRFWKFLYKRKIVKHTPESLDDMDIVIKKVYNQTQPLSPNNYAKVQKEARNGLRNIR